MTGTMRASAAWMRCEGRCGGRCLQREDRRSPSTGVILMRMTSSAIAILAVLAATDASAQSINLTGAYQCSEACREGLAGYPAFITQNGPDLNLLNEAGEPARAWPDWFAPATRIWIEAWNEARSTRLMACRFSSTTGRSGSVISDRRRFRQPSAANGALDFGHRAK